jgi:hypothetical protein
MRQINKNNLDKTTSGAYQPQQATERADGRVDKLTQSPVSD